MSLNAQDMYLCCSSPIFPHFTTVVENLNFVRQVQHHIFGQINHPRETIEKVSYLATTSLPDRPRKAWSMKSAPGYDNVGARSSTPKNLDWAAVSDGPVTCAGSRRRVRVRDEGENREGGA